MNKRGQVSTYFIMGILLVVILVGGYLVKNIVLSERLTPEELAFRAEADGVRQLVELCFEKSAEKALLALGFQGGHIEYPTPGFEFRRDLTIGYGLYNNENILPSEDEISNEISEFINFDVKNCANFSNVNFDVKEEKEPTSRVIINDGGVNTRLSWPVVVSKLGRSTRFSDTYEKNVPVKLGKLLKVSNDIVEYMKSHEGYVNVDYLEDTGFKNEIIKIDNEQSLIRLIDDSSKVNGESYTFQFANKVI